MHTDKDTSKNIGAQSAPLPEIDYSPKAHSRGREIMYGLKLIAAAPLSSSSSGSSNRDSRTRHTPPRGRTPLPRGVLPALFLTGHLNRNSESRPGPHLPY